MYAISSYLFIIKCIAAFYFIPYGHAAVIAALSVHIIFR